MDLRDPADGVMLCPRCDALELHPRMLAGIEIDVCPRCRGAWLDRGELEALTAEAVVRAGYAADLREDGDADLVTPARGGTRAGLIKGWSR